MIMSYNHIYLSY